MTAAEVSQYCRDLESFLCQKNGGHLIRIVGPAFEQVRGWAERGIPLKVARRGIERYCERAAARGPRRRPVRIEFCEADILELFDDWRRALGVAAAGDEQAPQARKPPLAAHIQKVIERLVAVRAPDGAPAPGPGVVDGIVGELDRLLEPAHRARGQQRADIIERLSMLDAQLLQSVEQGLEPAAAERLRDEAEADLTQFGDRLTPEARTMALRAGFLRLVREAARLPHVAFE